jgi:hypothetical protein
MKFQIDEDKKYLGLECISYVGKKKSENKQLAQKRNRKRNKRQNIKKY